MKKNEATKNRQLRCMALWENDLKRIPNET